MKKNEIKEFSASTRRAKAWKIAESSYSFLHADAMMLPMLRLAEPLTDEQIMDELREIITNCPAFYPAYLDLGMKYLKSDIKLATEMMDTGIEICSQINSWTSLRKDIEIVFDNLEKYFRFEFIHKHGDVDDQILNEIYEGLI